MLNIGIRKIFNRKINLVFFLFFVVVFALLYFLNLNTPMVLDDCGYAGVSSIKDIIKSQSEQYFTTNGRVISHGIVQFMGGIAGKSIFNIFNAIMFSLFFYLIYKHINTNKTIKASSAVLLLIYLFFVIWFLLPDQYITLLMIAGSLNYVWASVLVLAYILLFTEKIAVQSSKHSIIQIILFFLFSLLTGAFVELYSVPVFPALIVWLLVNKIKPNKAILFSLIGFFVGLLFVVSAPGNFLRFESANTSSGILKKLFNFTFLLFESNMFWLLLILAVLFLVIAHKNKESVFVLIRKNIFYVSAIIFSLGFIFLSGAWWSRTFFAVIVFLIILFFRLILSVNWTRISWLKYALILPVLILLSLSYHKEYKNIKENKWIYDDMVSQLTDSKSSVIVKRRDFVKSKMTFDNSAFSMEKENWKTFFWTNYYHCPPAIVLSQNIYDSLYVEPYYIQEQFKVSENCYTTSSCNYYIVPLDAAINKINNVELIYSDAPVLKLNAKMDYHFGDSFIRPFLYKNKDIPWIQKLFFTKALLSVKNSFNDVHEPYNVLMLKKKEKCLLIKKPARFKEIPLLSVHYN